jgi:Arc/MetJ-type ribon-helix-helix transcriptional regulator
MRTKRGKATASAPRGSIVKPQLVRHTEQSKSDLEVLVKRWGDANQAEVVRRALRLAVEQEAGE